MDPKPQSFDSIEKTLGVLILMALMVKLLLFSLPSLRRLFFLIFCSFLPLFLARLGPELFGFCHLFLCGLLLCNYA